MVRRNDAMRMGRRLRTMGWWPSGWGVRSQTERVRRITYLVLVTGVVVAWTGFLGVLKPATARTLPLPYAVAQLVGLVVFSVLYVRAVRAVMAGRTARGPVIASGVVAAALLVGHPAESLFWTVLAASWACVATLGMRRSAAAITCAATTVVAPFLAAKGLPEPPAVLLTGLMCTFLPWSNRFQLWLWEVVRAAEEGRQAQARLAVHEERLRFARDLHDLVGHSLTAIAVKSEVAAKLAEADARRAAAEMTEVRRLARETLREMRTAVRGYRTVDLDAELRSVRAVLEAGGIRCELAADPARAPDGAPAELPQDVSTLLAWVVREGATNVLRHSKASRCRIGLAIRDGRAVLEMRNDGAGAHAPAGTPADAPDDALADASGPPAAAGLGLAGLAERVAAAGGVLTAGPDGPGGFLLSAAVPLRNAA